MKKKSIWPGNIKPPPISHPPASSGNGVSGSYVEIMDIEIPPDALTQMEPGKGYKICMLEKGSRVISANPNGLGKFRLVVEKPGEVGVSMRIGDSGEK